MQALARALSILGHPMLLLPVAALLAMAAGGQRDALPRTALAFALFAGVAMGWSWWKVRSKAWGHIDASARHERHSLNRTLLLTLVAGAALAWFAGMAMLANAMAVASLVLLAALLTARWCTLSLHVAFAVFAAALLWTIAPWASLPGLVFAAALAWSRLHLSRHQPRDIVAGALAGAFAGMLFLWIAKGGA